MSLFCEKVNMTFILTIKHVINKVPVQLCSVFPRSEGRLVSHSPRGHILWFLVVTALRTAALAAFVPDRKEALLTIRDW